MALKSRGRQHHAAKTKFADRPAQLFDGLFRLLQRYQRESLKTRALLQVAIGKPVVPGTCHVDGELQRDHFAEGQSARRVEDRALDTDVFHELEPAVGSDLTKSAGNQLE